MIQINTHEAKVHLSRYLDLVASGETVVICRRNVPMAELRAIVPRRERARPIGLARGEFQVPDAFFDPLPDELLDAFEGR